MKIGFSLLLICLALTLTTVTQRYGRAERFWGFSQARCGFCRQVFLFLEGNFNVLWTMVAELVKRPLGSLLTRSGVLLWIGRFYITSQGYYTL